MSLICRSSSSAATIRAFSWLLARRKLWFSTRSLDISPSMAAFSCFFLSRFLLALMALRRALSISGLFLNGPDLYSFFLPLENVSGMLCWTLLLLLGVFSSSSLLSAAAVNAFFCLLGWRQLRLTEVSARAMGAFFLLRLTVRGAGGGEGVDSSSDEGEEEVCL